MSNSEKLDSNRHFYLYAKNHYERGDLIEDLKKIVAYRCGLMLEHVSKVDVYRIILKMASYHIKSPEDFQRFFENFKSFRWYHPGPSKPEETDFQILVSLREMK